MGWGWRPAACGGRGGPARVWAWVCLLAWAGCWAARAEGCGMGELRCHDGSCVSADQYCDGEADCAGSEDEPAHCTQCNRLYYGTVGKTYELQVLWPLQTKRAPVCNLTLVAAGGPHGDLIQLAFHKFTLGKLNSHTDQGCPHGHMQIIENQRIYRPGFWCGDGLGLPMYYSETPSVSVIITRLPTDNDLTALDDFPSYYVKMSYKFLRRGSAVVRYGKEEEPKYLGLRDKTTVCNAFFSNCDQQPCYVQSPNFPGMYPRNTTCYYHLKQTKAPPGKRAIIALSQDDGQLVHIKSQAQPHDTAERHLKLYGDCYYVGDYVRVYDGNSTTSPVLVTFCRGDVVPEIVSSGPDVLIEFTTSPFDRPNHEVPWTHLAGFELKAETRFIPQDAIGEDCRVVIRSSDNSSGWVEGASHSVPPNTTCVWQFLGSHGQVVWITFVYYTRTTQLAKLQGKLCSTQLVIADGEWPEGTSIARHCRDTELRTCHRARRLKEDASVRPCDRNESYVSTGRNLSIQQLFEDGSIVTKVSFLLRYEFVDRRQTGDWVGDPCQRVIRSDGAERGSFTFSAPRDVFLYGRGGRSAVSCSWRLLGAPDQVVRLTITALQTGSSSCRREVNRQTKALRCIPGSPSHMSLSVSEWPWADVELPLACVCTQDEIPLTRESHGPDLTLNMTIRGMLTHEDYSHYSFNASYEFLKAPGCIGATRVLTGAAGEVVASSSSSDTKAKCEGFPWLLKTPPKHALFLTLPRASLDNGTCASDTRLFFHVPGQADPVLGVCPAADPAAAITFFWPPQALGPRTINHPPPAAEDFDLAAREETEAEEKSFKQELDLREPNEQGSSLVVAWQPRSASQLRLRWLTTWTPEEADDLGTFPHFHPEGPGGWTDAHSALQCKELCPELHACIPSELWCDGKQHCPQGSDETVANCLLERVPWLYLTIASLTLLTLLSITVSAVSRHRQQKAKKRQQDARRVSTQESILPPKEKSLSAYALDYTDMDFETTV
ncbi:uncharacterized protein LOC126985386 [Eriocheir sinensis]|uniref:uncharacterized protein LOC126985386 n=1 Tax=Eriocheir sinensis TaxID=95602 RepID=UPI0021C69803|nr:uncharacterized protein LOC126985386 [Eriocheir sinensis]